MHILLTGPPGVGKSTVLQALLASASAPIFGFRTVKEAEHAAGESYVHIHPATGELHCTPANHVGTCTMQGAVGIPAAFDKAGVALLQGIPQGALVVMDELGVMESEATLFLRAVAAAFSANDVLGVIKPRTTPFLDAVRAQPDVWLYEVTLQNRETLAQDILQDILALQPGHPLVWA